MTIFSHRFIFVKVSSLKKVVQGSSDFLKSLPWLALKPVAKNYQINVISFYPTNIVILGVEIARLTRTLHWTKIKRRQEVSHE